MPLIPPAMSCDKKVLLKNGSEYGVSVKGGIATDIPTAQASSLSPVLLANPSYSTFYILLYILLFTLALVDLGIVGKKWEP